MKRLLVLAVSLFLLLPVLARPRIEIPAFRYRQTSHYCLRNGRVATSDNGVDNPCWFFIDEIWVRSAVEGNLGLRSAFCDESECLLCFHGYSYPRSWE